MLSQGTLSACRQGTAETSGLRWIRSALHYCTKHLGTQQLVTVLCNVRKQPTVRAGAGPAGGSWKVSMGWCGRGSWSSCSLLSCTSTMNRHRRQLLCCRNQYCSSSSLGAPPCTPRGACPQMPLPELSLLSGVSFPLLSCFPALSAGPCSSTGWPVTALGLGNLLTWKAWLLWEMGEMNRETKPHWEGSRFHPDTT